MTSGPRLDIWDRVRRRGRYSNCPNIILYFVFQHPSGRGSRLLIDINLIWRLALIEWMVDGLNKIGVLLCVVCSVTVGLVSEAQNWEMTD